ncbi:MAG TPA: HAD-IA family hydrolase [Myxococcales bacterium LLY-WYZ-16_1]|jgi:HAD superfamily hydrolase (TIGR01509 family)|nr:HAD-IA family hydrolase [Myxococcales bacterium LLY-WYZ-16_1]
MARTLLLDLDKTLINVEDHTDYCAAVEAARSHLGRIPDAPDVPDTSWGRCTKVAMDVLVTLSGRPEWEEVSSLFEDFEARGAERAEAMPGLHDFLRAIAGRPRAIVTLCGPRSANRVCERHDVEVDAIVTRSPEARIKPAPDQVQQALAALNAQPESSVMIGDSAWDEGAARAAGVAFIGLTNGKPTRQFSADCPLASNLTEAIPLILEP